jgi:hypothetical protein
MNLSIYHILKDEIDHDKGRATIHETCYTVTQTLPETKETKGSIVFSPYLGPCSRVHTVIIVAICRKAWK